MWDIMAGQVLRDVALVEWMANPVDGTNLFRHQSPIWESLMKFEGAFEVAEAVDGTQNRIETFLSRMGYKRVSDSPLTYRRGSWLGSLMSNSPLQWKTECRIEVERLTSERAMVSYTTKVNTTGQIVTNEEKEYWRSEIELFEKRIVSGEVDVVLVDEHKETTISNILMGLVAFFVVTFVVGFSVAAVIHWVDPSFYRLSRIASLVGIAVGWKAARMYWDW